MISDGRPISILLVEDEPLPAATMKRYLGRLADDVRLVENCLHAEQEWTANPPGLVLMDYRLPDGLGTDVVARQRAKGFDDVVICMTGEAELISSEMRKVLGIHAVLTKPVMLNVLREAVTEVFGMNRAAVSARGSSGKTRRIGKFRLVSIRGRFTPRHVFRVSKVLRNEAWLALDMTRVGAVDQEVWKEFGVLSRELSSRGGRLCVLAGSPEQREWIVGRIAGVADVFTDRERLRLEGNRLTAGVERTALLSTLLGDSGKAKRNE